MPRSDVRYIGSTAGPHSIDAIDSRYRRPKRDSQLASGVAIDRRIRASALGSEAVYLDPHEPVLALLERADKADTVTFR
jgi:hypothetical protein